MPTLAESDPPGSIDAAVNALVDRYRERCLWFLRPDYYPTTRTEQLRVLEYVKRYGDVEAFQQAGALSQWLLQGFSELSAS